MNCDSVYKTALYGLYDYPGYYPKDKLFPTKDELLKAYNYDKRR